MGRPIERVSGSIASGRSVVTRRDKDTDPLRGSLLPKRIVKGISGGAQSLLAGSEAHAHDASEVMVDDVGGREIGAVRSNGGRSYDYSHCGFRCDGASPFGIESGFEGGIIRQ